MPEHLRKIGTVTTVDAETGAVAGEKQNAFTLLPCAPDKCQECAVDHPHDEPHDQQSLYYQMRFHGTHGRWPTWSDAMAHCTPEVRAAWREHLREMMREHGLPVPDDLSGDDAPPSR